MNSKVYQESTFTINNFLEPNIKEGPEAVCLLLVRLLLLEPGTFQTHPDMGIGIVSKYRYTEEGKANLLKQDLQNQISTYLPSIQNVKVNVVEIKKTYLITVQFKNIVYVITYDNGKIKYSYQTLDNL